MSATIGTLESKPAGPTARVRTAQITFIVFAMVIGIVGYLDRAALSVANSSIRGEFGLSASSMGLLLSAFIWPYAVCSLFSGPLVDRFGPRLLIGAGLLIWSVAQTFAGFTSAASQLIAARVVLGVGEAPTFPSFLRMTRDWFPKRDQAFRIGFWNASPGIGLTIAPPLLTALMLGLGWRMMFVVLGGIGLVFTLVWLLSVKDVDKAGLGAGEREYLRDGEPSQPGARVDFSAWRGLFSLRATWALMLGYFGIVYNAWLFITWLPGYLQIQWHMSIPTTGITAAIPYVGMAAGSFAGGWVVRTLIRRGFSPVAACKLPTVAGTFVMAFGVLVASQAGTTTAAVFAITVMMFFALFATSGVYALAAVEAPANCSASLMSIVNFAAFIGGALAPIVTGFTIDATGSFLAALLIAAGVGVLSALALAIGLPSVAGSRPAAALGQGGR